MIKIEIIVLIIFIVIALAANHFLKKRRALRKARQEHELEILELLQEEQKAKALKERLSKSQEAEVIQQQPSTDARPQIKPAVKIAAVESVAPTPEKEKKSSCHIPQDSMLKRHFFSHLRSMIESQHAPRPTECVLRRHYDTMINAELDSQIMEMST